MRFETITKQDSARLRGVNGIHHYPAKMATQLGDYFIKEYGNNISGSMFDPFCGSGTTLLLSRLAGFDTYGCEILEVASLISEAKTTTLSKDEIRELEEIRDNCDFERPDSIDHWQNREIWFDEDVYLDLMGIRKYIEKYEGKRFYPALFVSLSDVVWQVSSADPDVLVPTRSKQTETRPYYETEELVERFQQGISKILDLQDIHKENGLSSGKSIVKQGDAKRGETWPGGEHDLILTSPPYGDGINYRRAVSLQTRFFDLDDQILDEKITKHTVGRKHYHISETDNLNFDGDLLTWDYFDEVKQNNPDRTSTIVTYLSDMSTVLSNMKSKLSEDGLIGLVIGNPEVANVRIPLHRLTIRLAEDCGLSLADSPKKDEITNRFQTPVRRSSSEPINYEYLIPLEHS